MVIELTAEGYVAHGDRQRMSVEDIEAALHRLLPNQPPGMRYEAIVENWQGETVPRKQNMLIALHRLVEVGIIMRQGEGVKGSPHTYWIPAGGSVSGFPSYIYRTETEPESCQTDTQNAPDEKPPEMPRVWPQWGTSEGPDHNQ